MKLLSLELEGFRRFEEKTKLNLLNKVICLIGPNEIGKTSVLDALYKVDSTDTSITLSGEKRDLTRRSKISKNQNILKATYYIEPEDLEQIPKEIKPLPKWFYISKTSENETLFRINSEIYRDKSKRNKISNLLKKYKKNDYLIEILSNVSINLQLEELISQINKDRETLDNRVITGIRSITDFIQNSDNNSYPNYIVRLSKSFESFLSTESVTHPKQTVINMLKKKIPSTLKFTDDARLLKSEYSFEEVKNRPDALDNLIKLSGIDIDLIIQSISTDDQGDIDTEIGNANDELKRVFSKYWSQSDISVSLRISDNRLHINIGNKDKGFSSIAESSDGVRYYTSLMSYVLTKQEDSVKPILLIDEAESHLHYDAQADLIQMFSKQNLASKVIYTTHSLGCMPEDFGTGIRSIQSASEDNKKRSRIKNWIWDTDDTDLRTVLFEMGAKTLAFIPIRYSVFTEGAVDLILLPGLLRETFREEFLGFQVLPGLAEIPQTHIALIEKSSPRTAFLVDSDDGGKKILKKLRKAKIPENQIFELSNRKNVKLTIEDFIRPKVYCDAFNEELEKSNDNPMHLKPSDFTNVYRMDSIKIWCIKNKITQPNKRDVAINLYEKQYFQPIVYTHRKQRLNTILYKLNTLFNSVNINE